MGKYSCPRRRRCRAWNRTLQCPGTPRHPYSFLSRQLRLPPGIPPHGTGTASQTTLGGNAHGTRQAPPPSGEPASAGAACSQTPAGPRMRAGISPSKSRTRPGALEHPAGGTLAGIKDMGRTPSEAGMKGQNFPGTATQGSTAAPGISGPAAAPRVLTTPLQVGQTTAGGTTLAGMMPPRNCGGSGSRGGNCSMAAFQDASVNREVIFPTSGTAQPEPVSLAQLSSVPLSMPAVLSAAGSVIMDSMGPGPPADTPPCGVAKRCAGTRGTRRWGQRKGRRGQR